MPRPRTINLMFPAKGLDRSSGYESQPPYSTPDCDNVRPFDTLEDRQRGGSRPGILKAYNEVLGSGNKVNLLDSVTITDNSGFRQFAENFQLTTLENNGWSTVASYSSELPGIYNPFDASIVYEDEEAKCGAIRDALSPSIDTDQAYTVELNCVPYEGQFGGKYTLWAAANDSSPDPYDEGLVCELIMTDETDSYSGNLYHYSSGSLQNTYAFTGVTNTDNAKTRKLWLLINGTSVKAYVDGTLETSQTISLTSPSTHKRVGFAIEATESGQAAMVESFLVQYYTSDYIEEFERTILVAGSNGSLYKETFEGVFAQVSTSLTLNDTARVRAVDIQQKLYIADYGDIAAQGSDGIISGSTLDAASVSDWSALGLNTNDFVVVITNGTGATVDSTYEIDSIAAGQLTLTSAPGDGSCTYHIERGPKVYDPSTNTLSLWVATDGQVPTGSKMIRRFRGRAVLAEGRLWAMSRQFDPLDWDYSPSGGSDDYSRAVAGQNSEAGEIGQPITAMIATHDDYMMFFSSRASYVLRGDPTIPGASLGPISEVIGCVGGDAITETENGDIIILSSSGLYAIPPGGAGRPQPISSAIPRELKNLVHEMYQVSLAYDSRDGGVHIFVQQDNVAHQHWWVDFETKGFFPVSLPTAMVPFCTHIHNTSVQDKSDVLLGCSDGYVRRFSELQNTDDGTEIESYVLLGPFKLGDDHTREGFLQKLDAVLDAQSASVDWSIQVGNSKEEAYQATTIDSGTWDNSGGIQPSDWPKVRGMSAFVRLDNSNVAAWALEHVTATIQLMGDKRLL